MVSRKIASERLGFVDEMGTNTSLSPHSARFSVIDPHRMMHTCDLTDGFVRTGIIALTYGQVSVNATRCYAFSKRGQRARCSAPRNRGPNTTPLASMTLERAWERA